MNLSKRYQTKDNELNSNNSNDYEVKSYILDQVYKEQLAVLRDLVFRTAQPDDIEICSKWLKVFNRISKAEKMARNCLCNLMKEQLEENGYLQYPFTNLQNCNLHLDCVLNELDDQVRGQLSDQSIPSGIGDTIKSDGITECNFEQQQHDNKFLQENPNFEYQTETTELIREMQALRVQLTERQIENVKLKESANKLRMEREVFEEMLDNMKKSILENIREVLLNMEQGGMIKKQFKFFQDIFVQFSNDKQFTDIVSNYDLDLQHVFNRQFKSDIDKQKSIITRHICRKFFKSKAKLREKFEHRLRMQNESHKLQLKLAKLNSFSILRQIFINYHNEIGNFEGWEILKALEDKYQNIVNGNIK